MSVNGRDERNEKVENALKDLQVVLTKAETAALDIGFENPVSTRIGKSRYEIICRRNKKYAEVFSSGLRDLADKYPKSTQIVNIALFAFVESLAKQNLEIPN